MKSQQTPANSPNRTIISYYAERINARRHETKHLQIQTAEKKNSTKLKSNGYCAHLIKENSEQRAWQFQGRDKDDYTVYERQVTGVRWPHLTAGALCMACNTGAWFWWGKETDFSSLKLHILIYTFFQHEKVISTVPFWFRLPLRQRQNNTKVWKQSAFESARLLQPLITHTSLLLRNLRIRERIATNPAIEIVIGLPMVIKCELALFE